MADPAIPKKETSSQAEQQVNKNIAINKYKRSETSCSALIQGISQKSELSALSGVISQILLPVRGVLYLRCM